MLTPVYSCTIKDFRVGVKQCLSRYMLKKSLYNFNLDAKCAFHPSVIYFLTATFIPNL